MTDAPNLRVIYGLVDAVEPERVRYVGQTRKGLEDRLRQHRGMANHTLRYEKKSSLYDWFRSCDVLIVALEWCTGDDHELNEQEHDWIVRLRAEGHELINKNYGGGYGGTRTGYHLSDETKRRMSEAAKALPPKSPETRAKIGEAHRGRKNGPHSEEWNRKIAEGNKGRVWTNEQRQRHSEIQRSVPNRGGHIARHVNQGVVNPQCQWCVDDVESVS